MVTVLQQCGLVPIVLVALLLDRFIPEPAPHPLAGFGMVAERLELVLNRGHGLAMGIFSTLTAVVPVTALVWWLDQLLSRNIAISTLYDAAILWFVIGWQSMKDHALAVLAALQQSHPELARNKVAMIVSRDTADMDRQQATIATVESVLENAHDCLFASLFWFAVAGPAGAITHRLVNTLDAMWGYRTERYNRFGRFAARLDDVLGFVPARLTALGYALAGRTGRAVRCWRQQASAHPGPNAGLVMATGAGALGIQLGGVAVYQGVARRKPALGEGPVAVAEDIRRSIRLVQAALPLWLAVFAVWCGLGYAG